MSTHNIHFMIELENFPKIATNYSFLRVSREFPRDPKNEFELAMVNELSVFESLKFYYNVLALDSLFLSVDGSWFAIPLGRWLVVRYSSR